MNATEQRDYLLQLCSKLTVGAYGEMALRGRIRDNWHEEPLLRFGSGQTNLSQGLSWGYSIDDIAHFYLRRHSSDDTRAALDNGNVTLKPWDACRGFQTFCEDIVWELGQLTVCLETDTTTDELWLINGLATPSAVPPGESDGDD